jgi:hypothetical protein
MSRRFGNEHKEFFEILGKRVLVKCPCPRGQGHFSEK